MSKNNIKRDKFSPITIAMLVVLSIYCFILLFMLLWALMQVFKFPMDFNKNPVWFPTTKNKQVGFTFINFKILSAYTETEWMPVDAANPRVPLVEVFINSIVYSLGGSLMNAMVMCIMAYLTARYAYLYSKIIYAIVIVVMVIPIVGAQASEIQVLSMLGLYNTRFGFLVLKASFVGMYFLVFYETFKNIPMTYSEAAMIDGASDWCIMTKICLPLVLNVFTTIALITFIQFWNDYQMAMLYMPDYPTLSYFLFQVQNQTQEVRVSGLPYGMKTIRSDYVPIKMTATVVLMTPILILFIALHERLMGNLSIGGIKG
ncbi:MAG: carbohydrate ABC transporter permease [Clostridia bacterium]|nr:carbohydrate ABC transporter permease [Clostridia bacterium]